MASSNVLTRILCVEDDPDIQVILQTTLQLLGEFEVLMCGSGMTALNEAAGFAPDMILLDVMMPELDGIQTYQRLRQQTTLAHTAIVFMTAKVQPKDIVALKQLGALDVIAKPFDPLLLCERLQCIWEVHCG